MQYFHYWSGAVILGSYERPFTAIILKFHERCHKWWTDRWLCSSTGEWFHTAGETESQKWLERTGWQGCRERPQTLVRAGRRDIRFYKPIILIFLFDSYSFLGGVSCVNWKIDCDKFAVVCVARETVTLFSQWWYIYLISLIRVNSVGFSDIQRNVDIAYNLWQM